MQRRADRECRFVDFEFRGCTLCRVCRSAWLTPLNAKQPGMRRWQNAKCHQQSNRLIQISAIWLRRESITVYDAVRRSLYLPATRRSDRSPPRVRQPSRIAQSIPINGVVEYSVEFSDMTGNTVALVTLPASALRLPTPADRPPIRASSA
jgi:hypothetical protein